jgi:hypothetical protein
MESFQWPVSSCQFNKRWKLGTGNWKLYRQFNWTEISFDTPGSSIVTPYNRSAISIVFRLWVIRMN